MSGGRWAVLLAAVLGVAAKGTGAKSKKNKQVAVPADAGYALPALLPDGGSPFFATDNPFEFARYKGRLPDRMGGQSMIGGAPTWISQMHLPDAPEEVRAYYKARFIAQKMPSAEGMPEGTGGALYLTFTDPRTKQMGTLTLVPQGDGQNGTMVFASVSYAANYTTVGKDLVPPEFPLPSDAQNVTYDQLQDGDILQRDISFNVPGKPEDVVAFFDRETADRGFKQVQGAVTAALGKWGRTYHRPQEDLMITISRKPDDKVTRISAIWIKK